MRKKHYYWRLIKDLNVWLSGLGATTMDLETRPDRLDCLLCGNTEEPGASPEKTGPSPDQGRFVVLEARQKKHIYNGQPLELRSYSYICLHCGLWQTAVRKGRSAA